MQRIIGIGDIHGNLKALLDLLDVIVFNPQNDTLVFVGDYIDRGNKSKQVVEVLSGLRAQYPKNIILLKGNHELMAERALPTGLCCSKHTDMWIRNGGDETIKSYGSFKKTLEMLPFLSSLPWYYETDSHIFVHAGFPSHDRPKDPMCFSGDEDVIFWDRDYENYQGKWLVLGHTPHKKVTKYSHCIIVDTKAYRNNLLSGYDILHDMVYNSNGDVYTYFQQDTS